MRGLLAALLVLSVPAAAQPVRAEVTLVPLGDFPDALALRVSAALAAELQVSVRVGERRALPAFTSRRGERLSADELIRFLFDELQQPRIAARKQTQAAWQLHVSDESDRVLRASRDVPSLLDGLSLMVDPRMPDEPRELVLGLTTVPLYSDLADFEGEPSRDNAVDGLTHVEYGAAVATVPRYDREAVFGIAVHEVGHELGLTHHHHAACVMAPYAKHAPLCARCRQLLDELAPLSE